MRFQAIYKEMIATQSPRTVGICVAFCTLIVLALFVYTLWPESLPVHLVLIPVLLACVIAGFAASVSVHFAFVQPFKRLVAKLGANRAVESTDIPQLLEAEIHPHLQDVVEQFNALIEEQHKAARQVRVKQQYLEYAAHHDPLPISPTV